MNSRNKLASCVNYAKLNRIGSTHVYCISNYGATWILNTENTKNKHALTGREMEVPLEV